MDNLKSLHAMQKYSAQLTAAMAAATQAIEELAKLGADDVELGICIAEYNGADVINLSVGKESNGQQLGMTGWHADTEISKGEIIMGVLQILEKYENEVGPISMSKADLN